MAFRGSKTMHEERKIAGLILDLTSKTTIIQAVWHIDSLCSLFQQALISDSYVTTELFK